MARVSFFAGMTNLYHRTLLVIMAILSAAVLWDATLGPDSGRSRLEAMRPDPPPLPPGARPQGAMRVLFIGNSFTWYWGGQALIGMELARSSPASRERPPIYEQSTSNGADLRFHWENHLALDRIREGHWDFVVLQEHSEGPLLQKALFERYAKLFDAEIKKVGAKTVLFMTWAKAGEPQNQQVVADAYYALARELGAEVVPVGLAFRAALTEQPGLVLHMPDARHPSAAGSYLTACCFYSFLYDHSAAGLTHRIYDQTGRNWLSVEEKDARFLQDVAYRTVRAAVR